MRLPAEEVSCGWLSSLLSRVLALLMLVVEEKADHQRRKNTISPRKRSSSSPRYHCSIFRRETMSLLGFKPLQDLHSVPPHGTPTRAGKWTTPFRIRLPLSTASLPQECIFRAKCSSCCRIRDFLSNSSQHHSNCKTAPVACLLNIHLTVLSNPKSSISFTCFSISSLSLENNSCPQ